MKVSVMKQLMILSVLLLLPLLLWTTSAHCQNLVDELDDESKPGELWAVLVAGSNEWMNYRHQADVCHAYQILHQHGVPDDHIIVMMYDDIAYNDLNTKPGVIINHPNGPNVYEGILKDYTGNEVTPHNFLNILRGNASAMAGIGSGKVVNSTSRDRIFVNLVDHGAPGIFAFPENDLKATQLVNTVLHLHRENKFYEMVFYVESCESGSLFHHLIPHDIRVYAITASSPHEPSYACYMDEELNTYLGDVFSIKWMEDTDHENIHSETLKRQFHLVHEEVTTSTVMQWGEHDIGREKLWKFMGERNTTTVNSIHKQDDVAVTKQDKKKKYQSDPCINSAVPSPDVPLSILRSRVGKAEDNDELQQSIKDLLTLEENRMLVDMDMKSLVKEVTDHDYDMVDLIMKDTHSITRWDCYDQSVDIFNEECFNLAKNPYALRVLQKLVNLCEHGYTADSILKAAKNVCFHNHYTGIN